MGTFDSTVIDVIKCKLLTDDERGKHCTHTYILRKRLFMILVS
jgi:hypothetical protein